MRTYMIDCTCTYVHEYIVCAYLHVHVRTLYVHEYIGENRFVDVSTYGHDYTYVGVTRLVHVRTCTCNHVCMCVYEYGG